MGKIDLLVRIPWSAPTDRRLKARDFQVLSLLCMHAGEKGWTKVSQVRLARQIKCSRGTLYRSLNRLGALGYLHRKNRTRINGKTVWHPFSPHTFHVVFEEMEATETMRVMRSDFRQQLWDKTGGKCFYCRSSLASDLEFDALSIEELGKFWFLQLQSDHKRPTARGGSNDLANQVPACGWCNAQKNKMTRDEYHTYLFERGIVARFMDEGSSDRDWLMVATVARKPSQFDPPSHPHVPRHNA